MIAEAQGNRKSKEWLLVLCCGFAVRTEMTGMVPADSHLHLSKDLVQTDRALLHLENILDLHIFTPLACLLFVMKELKHLVTCHLSIYVLLTK